MPLIYENKTVKTLINRGKSRIFKRQNRQYYEYLTASNNQNKSRLFMTTKNKSTKEIWIAIKGYEGIYEISNIGRVKSLERFSIRNHHLQEKILRAYPNRGYPRVALQKDGNKNYYLVHRLVAEAFIPNPENKPQVNHKNGIKTDNRLSNLEWATTSENNKHAYDTGLNEAPKGEDSTNSKLTKSDVLAIRSNPNNLSQRKLAAQFNVSQMLICRVINRKRWTHV